MTLSDDFGWNIQESRLNPQTYGLDYIDIRKPA